MKLYRFGPANWCANIFVVLVFVVLSFASVLKNTFAENIPNIPPPPFVEPIHDKILDYCHLPAALTWGTLETSPGVFTPYGHYCASEYYSLGRFYWRIQGGPYTCPAGYPGINSSNWMAAYPAFTERIYCTPISWCPAGYGLSVGHWNHEFADGPWNNYGCAGTPPPQCPQTPQNETPFYLAANNTICTRPGYSPGGNGPPNCCSGNPINTASGNKYQVEPDYRGAAATPIEFARTYNSSTNVSESTLGPQWRHTYDRSIELNTNHIINTAAVFRPDGKEFWLIA